MLIDHPHGTNQDLLSVLLLCLCTQRGQEPFMRCVLVWIAEDQWRLALPAVAKIEPRDDLNAGPYVRCCFDLKVIRSEEVAPKRSCCVLSSGMGVEQSDKLDEICLAYRDDQRELAIGTALSLCLVDGIGAQVGK
jgi:hypothetical protein